MHLPAERLMAIVEAVPGEFLVGEEVSPTNQIRACAWRG